MNKKKLTGMIFTAAALTAYSALTGKGIFNKMRFKNEHEAIGRYVDGNYPGAVYSPIQKTELGYAAIIRRPNAAKILLYAMPTVDGHYVFKEVK